MKTETTVFIVLLSINAAACIWNCIGIVRNNIRWDDRYLKGFDEGCKWTIEECKKIQNGKV